jgi:hypothetical protein
VNADDIETTDDATDLETFSNQAVTNNSEQFAVPSPKGMSSVGGVSCY